MAALEAADMLSSAWMSAASLAALYGAFLWLLGRWLLPGLLVFLRDHGLTELNYRSDPVPTAGGLLIWLLILVHSAVEAAVAWLGLFNNADVPMASPIPVPVPLSSPGSLTSSWCAVALLGFLDDTLGARTKVKGIAGHYRLWKEQRRVSTGLIKAGGILLAAIPVVCLLQQARGNHSWLIGGIQVLLLGFMANGVNLLDLRPGRALKAFIALLLLLCSWAFASWNSTAAGAGYGGLLPDMLPVVCGALALLKPNLRGQVMLGDTGANLLGFAAGCWAIVLLGWPAQCALLALLVLLHILTWRRSLSSIIERNRVLQWLDQWGRRGPENIEGA
ncbi:hypothetical protein ACHHV8_20480 [Paenibacillus sp. TAB 01]|uniref:hypothetical protein n=1 Tax=Paenibacillus sp. TAB 01 TaxID=3368988 RepID=UPI00375144CE